MFILGTALYQTKVYEINEVKQGMLNVWRRLELQSVMNGAINDSVCMFVPNDILSI